MKRKKLLSMVLALSIIFSMLAGTQTTWAASTGPTISSNTSVLYAGEAGGQKFVLTLENDTFNGMPAGTVYLAINDSIFGLSYGGSYDANNNTQFTIEINNELHAGDVISLFIYKGALTGGTQNTNTIELNVEAARALAISTTALNKAKINSSYSHYFTAIGGIGAKSYTCSSGILPEGLTLSTGGLLSGTPETPGTYNFDITVTDSRTPAQTDTASYTMTIAEPSEFLIKDGAITGYTGAGGDITIPSEIDGEAVTAIGAYAFNSKHSLTSVVIPDSVTSIGNNAFSHCSNLSDVALPNSITSMGTGVFYSCIGLVDINIPDQLTDIPVNTFALCYDLQDIIIPDNIESIGEDSFFACTSLKGLKLPAGITSIGNNAFKGCSSLKNVVVPASVTSIGNNAFSGESYSLNSINCAIFLGAAPAMGTDVFAFNSAQFKIYYPSDETGYTNPWHDYPTESYIAASSYEVTYAANGATGDIPPAATGLELGDTVVVEGQGDLVNSGCIFEGWNTAADGSGTSYAAGYSLLICKGSVTLYAQWNRVYGISIDAVEHGKIETNTLEASEGAYIETYVTPDLGYVMKEGSLKYNDGTADHIIDYNPFEPPMPGFKVGKPSYDLYVFEMPAADITITAEFESREYTFDETTGTILEYHGKGGNVIIPYKINGVQVKAIGSFAFSGESGIKASSAPKAEADDTENCILTGVVIPEGVLQIRGSAFSNCSELRGVTLPGTLDYIGYRAFYNCNSLRSIRIPDNVTEIGDDAFSGCDSLISASFEGDAPEDYIGDDVFDFTSPDFRILYHTGSTGFDAGQLKNYEAFEIESFDPATAINADIDDLEIVFAFSDNKDSVEGNLYLTVTGAVYGSDIAWGSDNPNIISVDGLVTRPYLSEGDAEVTLTATVSNNGSEDTKAFDLTVLEGDQSIAIHTVTFSANGGSTAANPSAMTAEEGKPLGSLPTAPTRSGYIFTGWSTKADGSGSTFTATTIVTDDITVYAQWKKKNTGGDSSHDDDSSGGGSSSNPSIPPAASGPSGTTTTTPASNNGSVMLAVGATIDSNGRATANVSENQVTAAINQATPKVELRIETPAGAKAVEANLPKKAIDALAGSNKSSLTISNTIAAITFDEKALDTIAGEAAGGVKITSAIADTAGLSEETRQIVGDHPVYNFSVTSGDKTISQLGGNVTVTVPYTPKAGEDLNAIVIYYINAEGKPEMVSNCVYDPETGKISFTTNHFSRYAVGYNKPVFTDVAAAARYRDAVTFVSARGIAVGTGDGKFNPDGKLTRGQFLVMVMKAYGIVPEVNAKDNFADAGNTYYTNYLAAARRLGITSGVGGNRYAPEKELSRQEMYTLLYKTLKAMDRLQEVKTEKAPATNADSVKATEWAKEALSYFAGIGAIAGDGLSLKPTDTASRAEMAEVLFSLLNK